MTDEKLLENLTLEDNTDNENEEFNDYFTNKSTISLINVNQFMVLFPVDLKIEQFEIDSVDINGYKLMINIRNNSTLPILKIENYKWDDKKIIIKYFDEKYNYLYERDFIGLKLIEIYEDPLTYNSDCIQKIHLIFTFNKKETIDLTKLLN